MAQIDFPGIIGEERVWCPLRRQNSVPRRRSELQSTAPHRHPAPTSAIQQILVVTIPRVAETFQSVIEKFTYGTDFKLINLLHNEIASLTHENLNTSISEPENRWNICLVAYDTLTS